MSQISNKTNFLKNLFSSLGGTILSTIIGFISVPISLNYWEPEKYGLWALLISVSAYLSLSNLGLNAAATILMTKNPNVASKLKILKKTFNILIISVVTFLFAFILINISNINWIMLLGKIPDNLKNEALLTAYVIGIFFFINLPFSLISSSFQSFQKIYIDNVFSILLIIINFLNLLFVILIKGNLVTFALISGTSTLLVNIIRALYFYFYIYQKVKTDNTKLELQNYETSYKNIFITGIRYFLIVTAAMVVVNTDLLVISNFLEVKKVTPYSVTLKLFLILNSMILLTTSSLLPIMAREFGYSNWNWINKVYERMLIAMSFIGGLIWIGGVLFTKDIIYLWTGEIGYAGIITVFFLGGYSYLLSMVNLNAGIVTTFNYLKGMPVFAWIEAILKLGFSILLLKYFDVGGVAIGSFLGSLLSATWILPIVIAKKSQNKIHYNLPIVLKQFLYTVLPLLILSVWIQLFVPQITLRILLGTLVIMIYCLFSYNNTPKEIKVLLINKLIKYRVALK